MLRRPPWAGPLRLPFRAAAVLLAAWPAVAGPPPSHPPACASPEARGFDFWIGEWDVVNRYKRRTATDFREVGRATDRVHPVAGGCGIVEHWIGWLGPNPIVGFSVRSWDPATGRWDLALLWPRPDATSFTELQGTFRHGRGEFVRRAEGELTRYTFSDVGPDRLRWDDAYSEDGGVTWRHSWIMEFRRRSAGADPLLANGPSTRSFRCAAPRYRAFDQLDGEWAGTARRGGEEVPATLRSVPILGGCAVMDLLTLGDGGAPQQAFAVRAFEDTSQRWVEYRLDSERPALRRLEAERGGDGRVFAGDFEDAGGPLRVRARWEELSAEAVALTVEESRDRGATWVERWSLRLARRI